MRIVLGGLKLGFWLAVLCLPFLGAWIASSLAAYAGWPMAAAIGAALLAFPVAPVAWEGLAGWLRRRRLARRGRRSSTFFEDMDRKRREGARLKLFDRLFLRTLALSLVFVLTATFVTPGLTFAALSTRGAWFLDGVDHPAAEATRATLDAASESFAWLHRWTHPNAFEGLEERPTPPPPPPPVSVDDAVIDTDVIDTDVIDTDVVDTDATDVDSGTVDKVDESPQDAIDASTRLAREAGVRARLNVLWRADAVPHARAKRAPEAATRTPAALGEWALATEPDPALRLKLLHDWVALHVDYDADSLRDGTYPTKQSSEQVLRDRLGVCSGYANLMVAAGEAADLEIVYVVGDTRKMDGPGHAWNAAKIDGVWTLMDVTWDAGFVNDGEPFTRRYTTAHLFTPPAAFGLNHFPDEEGWQLREEPLTRGAFLRQQPLGAALVQKGWTLHDPQRTRTRVGQIFTIELSNVRGRYLAARIDGDTDPCRVERAGLSQVARCIAAEPGTVDVVLFDLRERYGGGHSMGRVSVDASF